MLYRNYRRGGSSSLEETQQRHGEIPWSDIIGQRNILAHKYGQIDYELLHKTATQDVPRLIVTLERLLNEK